MIAMKNRCMHGKQRKGNTDTYNDVIFTAIDNRKAIDDLLSSIYVICIAG